MCIYEKINSKKEEYVKYLQDKIEWEKGLYLDPDGIYNSEYYENIVAFLNKQEEKLIKKTEAYKYVLIKKSQLGLPRSIAVYKLTDKENENPILFLRSDLFGFSAPREEKKGEKVNNLWSEKYPYASYLLKSKEEELDKNAEFVANTIWKTRNIGGTFLWPLIREAEQWKSLYNRDRGVKCYIEDSVDLTLWEIKQMYKYIGKDNTAKDNTEKAKSDLIISKGSDKELIFQWLSHFGCFENYVKFFAFEAFVSEENIIDITSKERKGLDSAEVDKYRKEFSKNSQNGRIRRMEKENLESLLKNIAELIEARTKAMNKVIGE